MKRKEFIDRMNKFKWTIDEVNMSTCGLMIFTKGDYDYFIAENYKCNWLSVNQILFKKYYYQLSPQEKQAIYYLRIALLATFTAWALKTKAYRRY